VPVEQENAPPVVLPEAEPDAEPDVDPESEPDAEPEDDPDDPVSVGVPLLDEQPPKIQAAATMHGMNDVTFIEGTSMG
jgi:hypothetical protein